MLNGMGHTYVVERGGKTFAIPYRRHLRGMTGDEMGRVSTFTKRANDDAGRANRARV